MTQEEFNAKVADLTRKKNEVIRLHNEGKITLAQRKSGLSAIKDQLDALKVEAKKTNAAAKDASLKAKIDKIEGKRATVRAGQAPKGVREYNAELKKLRTDLETVTDLGEKSRIKSRISTIENVLKRFKTKASDATAAAAQDAGVSETPKMGTGKRGRPTVREVKLASITKGGKVNIGQARAARKMGIITDKEFAQYEELYRVQSRRGTTVDTNASRPAVDAGGPKAKVVAKREKPKTSTTSKPSTNKPSGRVRSASAYKITGQDGKINVNAAKRAYDDGIIDKSEFEQFKKRAISQNRPTASKPTTKRPAQLTKAQVAAANARDRGADIRDLANQRDRAADVRDLKNSQSVTQRRAAAKGMSPQRLRGQLSQSMPRPTTGPSRGTVAASKVSSKEVTQAIKVLRSSAVNSARWEKALSVLKTVGKAAAPVAKAAGIAGRVAGAAATPIALTEAAYQLSTVEGLKNAAASRIAVMEAAAGKRRDTSNMFTTADIAKAKAIAKKAAADLAMKQRADRNDSSRKTPTAARRGPDTGDSSRTPKALPKTSQNRSVARLGASGGSVTVKRGDTLWGIAQANNTSVNALLKANPTIAKRKAAGKVDIYSGSKVRLPGKKK